MSAVIAGRYSLDREIGRGGAGVVWLGHDEVLGRPVALKRIGGLAGAEDSAVARAEREARISARLNHPHVVSVFDFVVDAATDERWLVMEYVDGPTLAQAVREGGPLSTAAAAPVVQQMADALAAAHEAGIVHRDVKPSNILLGRDGWVKLTDFGIAHSRADSMLTQTGLLTGSPAYLAPEVVEGSRGDERSDVWSLGATAWFALTGRPPYEGDNVISTLYQIVNGQPPRLQQAGWMAELVASTMVTDPGQRWTAAQVRDFVARHTGSSVAPAPVPLPRADAEGGPEHTQVLTLPPTPVGGPVAPLAVTERPAGWRTVVIAGVLVGALALGVLLFTLLHHHGGTPARDTAARTPSARPAATTAAARPTAAGMEAFIRSYVAQVSADPNRSWTMLTPKFQAESGGLATYRRFWERADHGRVLSISADPKSLVVRYQVHFDHFDNGPGPTVLGLVFHDGRYLIDAEYTKGFHPED